MVSGTASGCHPARQSYLPRRADVDRIGSNRDCRSYVL